MQKTYSISPSGKSGATVSVRKEGHPVSQFRVTPQDSLFIIEAGGISAMREREVVNTLGGFHSVVEAITAVLALEEARN
jgi:hypothetical protein